MLRTASMGVLLVAAAQARSQSVWDDLELPRCPYIQRLCVDSENADVYYFGQYNTSASCGLGSTDLYRRHDGGWDSLTSVPGTVREMVMWRDTLFVCGNFIEFPQTSVFYYAEGDLHAYGSISAGSYRLRVIEDTLWAVGAFGQVDGESAYGVAKRVGAGWMPVGVLPSLSPYVFDIIKYQGELIAVGNGQMVDGRRGIYHLVDGVWQVMGDALQDLVSQAGLLTVYQDLLYIGGSIQGANNAGHGLVTWNGSEYMNVGGGLTWNLGDYYTLTGVRSMEVRNGLLYVGGGFFYAGDLPTQGLVTWDGERWCDVQGDFMGPSGGYYISDMAFSGDSLYVACTGVVDDMEDVFAAAAAVADLPGECQDVGVPEGFVSDALFTVVPNPAQDAITIGMKERGHVRICDALGREMWNGLAQPGMQLDLSSWPVGLYSVSHAGRSTTLLVER